MELTVKQLSSKIYNAANVIPQNVIAKHLESVAIWIFPKALP